MEAKGLCALKENIMEHHCLKSLEVILKGKKQRKNWKPHKGLAMPNMSLNSLGGGRAIKEAVKLDR